MADDKQKLLDVVTTTKLNDEDFFFIGQKNSVKKIRKENVDFPTDDTLTKEGYPADAKAVGSAIEDLQGLALSTGQPIGVNTKLKMIDTTKNYLYLGEENGFEYGYIYTYVNGAWTKTRLYGKGRDGVDGYTVILTNESYIFPGTVETAQEDEVITEVMVYKGDEVITPTSILVGDLPTGLTAFVHGPLITFTSTTDLVKSNGAIPITIVADRKIFTKYFCYAIAFIGTEHIDFDFDGLNDTLGTLSNNIEGIEQNLTDNYYNKSYFDIDNGDFTLGIERKYKDEIESQLGGYSTTGDTKALIRASADELSSTISTTYSTKNAVNDLANRVNRAVKGVRIEYISIRKGITPEDDDPGWSTAAPQWKDTCDIWQRVVTETATDVYYSNITNISGRDGSAITLDAQVVEYAVSASGTEPPDENADWSLSIPNVPVGSFLWTRTTVVYSDGQYTEAYTVSYRGGDGQIEVSISSIEERYAISNSTTEPADNAFQTSPIPVMTSVNPYLWNYEIISYSDGSTDSTSKKIIGHYGRDGTNGVPGLNGYVHTAWANSADGSTGFSTSVSENKLYLGTYTDNSAPDSNNPSDYNWSLIKGDDGVGITSIVNYYLKTNRQTGVTTAVSEGWSDDPSTQVVDANNPYLWNYEVITYSNGVSSASDPCIIGNYSESGTSISIVSSSVEYQKSESGTVRPTTWLNSLPSLSQGEFLWSKTHVVYSDGTETIAYSVSRFGVDGTPGEDAYTVVLSNENHTFVGTTTHALSGGTTSAVSVYKGSTPVTVTHITVGTKPTGLNSEVNGSTVTFTATESLTTPHGTIPITIEIAGGLTFTKYFSYSIAFAGADAPLISVTADTNVILIDKTGTYIPSTNISVVGTASNTTITSIQYSVDNGAYSNTLPTGVSVSGTTVTVAPQTSIFNTLSIKMSDGSISDTTTIMRVREGRGIASVVEYYVVNNDSSQAPVSNAFGTTIPTMTASNPYLWNYERITYSDGSTPIETTPCIIGRYGSDGTSISNVINYYLATNASSNVTRATTGWTTTIQEVNSTHKYLWNYEEVVFSDSTSVSTSPCVIGNYAADGEDGVDAISCILTNESHVFAGSATAALQASTTTDIIAYKGTQELTIDDVTWSAANIPTGMTLSKSNDKKTITISVTTDMTTANGTIPLNISTDGKIIVKHFSYSVSFKGVNAPSISVVPETNAIIIDKDNNYTPNGSFTVTGFAFNTTITSYQYKVDNGNYITTAPTGVTRSGNIVTINPTTSTFNTLSIRMGDSTINDTTTIIRVREGSDGDDGVSVESITEYYVATNSTTAPADNEFSTTIQQISSTNQYLWNYEVITYSDGDTVPSAKRIIGRYGQDGSSVTVSRTEYQAGTSATTAPTGTWLTSIPSVTEGQYLWTKVTYSDNSTAYSVAKQGVSGTSVTISSIEYAYQLSTSGTTVPTGAWSSAPQAPTATQYAWTRTTTTYSDGNVATTYTVGGKTGTSITISSKSVTYQASASGTTTPTGTWSNSVPSVDKGKFLWTKTYVKYSDNNETTSYSVAYRGTDGTSVSISQESVTYQTSSSGTTTPTGTWQNSVPSVAQGQFLWTKTYVKYSDNTETTSYSVSRYGSDGVSITDVTNYYLASALASGVTTSTTGWTTSIQTTDSSKPYLWNYEVVTYSSGNPTTTDPCIIGNYASDGVDAISCVLTNESHIFAGDDSHALASSTTTDILLFRGATPITPQQVTYTNSEQGKLNVSVSNDNKTITFTATTSLTSSSGNIPITIKVDNNTTITKTFSWSVSFRGADASIITLTSPTQVIKVAENNNKTPNSSFEVTGAATNTTITSWTFGVDGAAFSSSPPTGVTVNTTTNTVTINPATVTFKTLSIKAANSTGQTFDIFTIVQVQDGVTGAPGTGIREVIALYKKTTSKTESKPTVNTESQWSTTPPEWSLGYYIHTCSKITYTDDNVSYTTPSCDSSWEAIYGLNVGGSNLLYWSEKLHDSKETNPTYVPYLNMTITGGVANSNPNSVTKNCYFGSWPKAISYTDVNNQELTYSIFCKTTDSWGSYNANTNCIMLTVRLVDGEGVQKLSKDLFFENGVKTKTTTPNYTPKSYWTQANVTFFVEDGLFDTGSYNGDKSELYFEIITYNYSTHDLSLKLPKLEIGNIATAWTPNTQDLIGYTDNKLLNYSTTADIINSITNSTSGIGGAIQGKITETTTFIDSQGNPINIVDLKNNQTSLAVNLEGYETTVSEISTNLTNEINQRKATYGTSNTDAGTATKVVTCSNFDLYPGATISVKFSNENTNATPALNVNNTGAKIIKTFKGSALAASEYRWETGSVLDFVYDGIDWIFVDNGMTARVTSAESRITQNAGDITLKVSKNDVINSINLSTEGITIDADKVNIAGAAIFTGNGRLSETSLNNTIQNSIDDFEIGGRNLLLDTNIPTEWENITLNANNYGTKDCYKTVSPIPTLFKENDLVTISFDWETTATSGFFRLEAGNVTPYNWGTVVKATGTNASNSRQVDVTSTNTSGHVSVTWRISSAAVGASTNLQWMRIRVDGDGMSGKSLSISNAKAERGSKATDWTQAPEDFEDMFASKTEAVSEEQYIYISKPSGTSSVDGTTTWVAASTASTDSQNTWTIKRPTYNASYPVLFVAKQKKTVSGAVTCTTPVKDDTTTVIDGGHITTGTIDASQATITNINASNINSGTLNASYISVLPQSKVTNLETDLANKASATDLTTEINQRKATYGTSSTTENTQIKAVTCSNFELVAGNEITVKFSKANTYSSGAVQLSVNGKTAKNIWVANAVTSATNQLLWAANAYITFRYDGTQFIVIGEPRTWYGASTTASGTAAKTDTTAVVGCVICKGAKVELAMSNNNTSTSTATLNIGSTGAKNIYYGNTTNSPTVANGRSWLSSSTATFTFDGQYWRMAGQTVIDGNSIVTGTVSADRLNIGDIIADGSIVVESDMADAISEAIDGIEIGGRNLARHTSSEWRSQVITDGENKLFYLFPSNANERDNYSTDLTSYGFKVGDVIQLSFDIKFSDDFIASGSGTKHSYMQGNKNWLGGSWMSLSLTGGNRETAIEEIISSISKEGHVNTYFNITSDMLDGTYTGYLYITIRFDYYTGTVYVKNVMLEKSDKPSIWSLAPEDITTEEQRIYYRSSSSTAPNGNGLPIAWVTENGNKYNADATTSNGWSRKITSMANGSTKYPYLWTCIQRRTANGDISYTDILLDDTTTVIDGGNIITNSVTANQLSADAIKSNGYTAGASGSPYSSAETFLDLSNGNIYTPNFGVNNGDAYFKGEVIGGNKTSYNSNNSGYYLGSDGKFGLGNGNSYIQYDGTNLNIKGSLTLTSGQSVEEYVSDVEIGGRNLLLDTENMYKWKLKRGASINNGVATFIDVSNNVWREIESTFTLPYSNIRNKTVTMSCYVKAPVDDECAINLCLGVSGSKYSYNRKNYKNCYIYFTGTGKWEKVSTKVDITDAYFTSDSGSDFENGNIAFVAGAVNSYHNGFQAKKFKLELGDFATDWSPAPEDAIKGDGQNMFINTYDTSMISGNRYSRPMLKDQATFTYMLNTFTIVPHGIRQIRTTSYPIFRFGTGTIGTETLNGFVAGETYTLSFDCTYNLFGSGAGFSSSETAYLNLYFYDNRDNENSYTNVWTMTFHTYDTEDTSDRGQTFTKHVEFTYYVPDNVTKCYFMVRSHSTTSSHFATGDFVEIRNLMLEKGMNSSGYAPSSYDLDRISYSSGNLFTNSDTFEGWGINELSSIKIVDGIVDYRERNLLGDTSNSTAPTTQNSNASNTFGSIGGYNTSASSISVGTYDESSNYLTATETATGNRGVGWYTKSGVVEYGEVVTFSCRVKANISTSVHTHTAWRNNSSDNPSTASYTGWTSGGSVTIEANTWTDYSYTFTCGSLYQEGEFYVALCFTGNSSGLTWQVAHAKLEKGNTATDWTPAPEDNDANNEPAIDIDEDGAKIVHYWLKQGSGEATWRQIANALDDNGVYIPYSKVRNKRLTFSCYVKYANAEDVNDDNVMRFVLALCHEDSSTRSRYSYQLTPYPSSNQWSPTTDWQRIYFTFELTDDLLSQTGEAQNTALDPVNDRLFIQFYNHSFKECWIKKPMLTIGTVVEDWSPQVASVNSIDLLTDSISSVSSLLNETSSEISDKLTNFKDEYDVFKGEYGEFETSIGERVGDAETNITGLKGSVSKLQSDFNEYRGRVEDYLTYNKGLLQLGTKIENSNTHEMILASSLNLTSTRLEFKLYDYENNGEELPDSSYMTAQMLYNKNLQTDNALILGTVSKGRFAFANLGEGLAFGLASDLLGDELLNDPARKGNNAT